MTHPYEQAEDRQFWNRSVARTEAHLFNPVGHRKFEIAPHHKIATAGSCFAQHIANALRQWGCSYLVRETGEGLAPDERVRRQYGTFSARYGNIYTTAQLNQLMDEAFGWRIPQDRAWQRPDGRWIDPLRQQVEPDGFESVEALLADRLRHLQAVTQVFSEADVFIFTMGLTEAWRSRADGTVFSSAPGVVGGCYTPDQHEFVNLGVAETHAQLRAFLVKLRAINPQIKVLLTVSPVPLVATYEPASVVCATTYSKSVLRVVAEIAQSEFDWVDYYPSFEIITGSQSRGLYFEEDARQVNRLGVAHAMRVFMQEYLPGALVSAAEPSVPEMSATETVLCDEEFLNAVAI